MYWRKKPGRLSCVLLLAAATLPLWAIAPAPSAPTCDAVMQWARDYRDSLPRDYRSLLAYPLDQRRAIYTGLTAAEKVAFWNDRIGLYLEEHPQLDAGQLRAVAEVQAFLKPGLYEAASPLLEQEIAVFADRMKADLGAEVAQELLFGLGPEAPGRSALLLLSCVCRIRSAECPGGRLCLRPNSPCTETQSGCGPLGSGLCNGMCFDPP